MLGLVVPASHNKQHLGLWVPAPVRNCALGRDDAECVAPLVGHTSAFSRHDLSELCLSFRPLSQRAQGKPGADRTHGPRAIGRKLGGRTTGVTGNNPAFPARWVTAYTCSPRRDWALLSPSPQRASRNVKRHLPLGRQACTISPSALRALVSHTLGVHRISTHVRDDREAPLDRVRRANLYTELRFG